MYDTIASIKCGDCSSEVSFSITIAAVVVDKKTGDIVIHLMLLARCSHCYKRFGDKRSVRLFIEVEQEAIAEAIANGLPVVEIQNKGE